MADVDKDNGRSLNKKHISQEDLGDQSLNYYNSGVVAQFIEKLQEDADKAARDKKAAELAETRGLEPNDPQIQNAVKKVRGKIDLKLFTDGKGEKLDARFAEYLKTRPDYEELDSKVQAQINDLNNKLYHSGKYRDGEAYDFDADPEGLKEKIAALSGVPTSETIQKKAEEYVREGGYRYSAMLKNAEDLVYGNPEPEDYLKAVNSVLEYQDEHLDDKTGPHAQRVNDSMRLLNDMTKGTGLEEYLDRQISRVNEARGLKPGDPGFIKKSDFVEEAQEIDGPEESEDGLDIGNKLKSFSFLKNDNSVDEGDMENKPEKKEKIDDGPEMQFI